MVGTLEDCGRSTDQDPELTGALRLCIKAGHAPAHAICSDPMYF